MRRHCGCGEKLPEGKWYCGPDCKDLDLDTSYAPEENPDHGASTQWDRD